MSLFGTTASAVTDKILIREMNYLSLMFYFYLFLSVIYFLVVVLAKKQQETKQLFQVTALPLVLAITAAALLADLVYFAAVAIPATLIVLLIPLRNLSIVLGTIIGGSFFKEKNILYKSALCLSMLVGVYFIVA